MLPASPSVCWCPCLRVGVPLVVYPVALLNGGGGVCCDAPVFGLGPASCIVLLTFVWSSPPFSLCVCCHSIVGLGLCLCGRVVSLRNGGDGLCGAEERGASIVHCPLSTLVL